MNTNELTFNIDFILIFVCIYTVLSMLKINTSPFISGTIKCNAVKNSSFCFHAKMEFGSLQERISPWTHFYAHLNFYILCLQPWNVYTMYMVLSHRMYALSYCRMYTFYDVSTSVQLNYGGKTTIYFAIHHCHNNYSLHSCKGWLFPQNVTKIPTEKNHNSNARLIWNVIWCLAICHSR